MSPLVHEVDFTTDEHLSIRDGLSFAVAKHTFERTPSRDRRAGLPFRGDAAGGCALPPSSARAGQNSAPAPLAAAAIATAGKRHEGPPSQRHRGRHRVPRRFRLAPPGRTAVRRSRCRPHRARRPSRRRGPSRHRVGAAPRSHGLSSPPAACSSRSQRSPPGSSPGAAIQLSSSKPVPRRLRRRHRARCDAGGPVSADHHRDA